MALMNRTVEETPHISAVDQVKLELGKLRQAYDLKSTLGRMPPSMRRDSLQRYLDDWLNQPYQPI